MRTVGPYRLVQPLARGGMGAVYRALGPRGETVALKLLLQHRTHSPQALARFQAEARTLSRLRHPNVVSILDAGSSQGTPWLALEFVPGETLEARLRAGGPLPPPEAARLVQALARALAYVHGCGVVHRDLKPDNILLHGPQPKLTDFGIALDTASDQSRVTATGVFQGTPGYWAPEQARGAKHDVGPLTDVYGLGAVLFACLTGRPPLEAETLPEHLLAAAEREVPAPSHLAPGVPPWLDALTLACLAKDPQRRPPSMEAVLRALTLGGPRSPRRRPRRWLLAAGLPLLALPLAAIWLRGGAPPRPAPPRPAPEAPQAEEATRGSEDARLGDPAVQALMARALRHCRHEEFAQARAVLDEALALAPQNPYLWSQRGWVHTNLEDFAGAVEDYTRTLELDPTPGPSYGNRAGALVALGRPLDALPDYREALARGLPEGNRENLRELLIRSLTRVGAEHHAATRYARAIAHFEGVLELDPQNVDALNNRGMARINAGELEAGVADLDRALAAQASPSPVSLFGRGFALMSLGRWQQAADDFTRLLELDPDDARSLAYRGGCYAQLGRFEEALADLGGAIARTPNDPLPVRNRGSVLATLGRHAEALEDYDRALALSPPPAQRTQILELRRRSAAALER